jgi:hypothetical protein
VLGSAGEEPAGSSRVGIEVMVYVEIQYVQSKGQWDGDGGMMMEGKRFKHNDREDYVVNGNSSDIADKSVPATILINRYGIMTYWAH